LTFSGIFFGTLASLFNAINAIYTHKILMTIEDNIWRLSWCLSFIACFIFIPLIIVLGEIRVMYNFPMLNDCYFWSAMSVSGVLGFSVSYVTSLQIQLTSALTHNVSGVTKSYVQTILGVFYYSEYKSVVWWLSSVLVLGGSTEYSRVRMQEMIDTRNQLPRLSKPAPLLHHEVSNNNSDSSVKQ
jgi:GDP-fucose transporter C1